MNNRNSQSVSKRVAGKSQPWDTEQAMAIISEYASRDYTSSIQANGKHASHVSGLIPALQALQHCFGYIDNESLPLLAQSFNLSRAEVHGVVSFYHDFRKAPPGNCVIKICQAESCQAMGSRQLSDHARSVLGIDFHETTDDGAYTLEPVYCLGNCACSPAIMIDGKVHGRVESSRFDALLNVSGGNVSGGNVSGGNVSGGNVSGNNVPGKSTSGNSTSDVSDLNDLHDRET